MRTNLHATVDPTELLLSQLSRVTQRGSGWDAQCPCHDDSKNSLCINRGDDGRALLHCQGGCETRNVVQAIGLDMKDLFPTSNSNGNTNGKKRDHGAIVAEYHYFDADGALQFTKVRCEDKHFSICRPDGKGGRIWNMKGVTKVLYNLLTIIKNPRSVVFGCEGEKDADRLSKLGLCSTTNYEGASKSDKPKWTKAYSQQLKGRHIVILPDNDEAGQKHAQAVAQMSHGLAASIRIINLPNLPEKGDVSDWLDAGGTREQLEELVRSAPLWKPAPSQAATPNRMNGSNDDECEDYLTPETCTDLANARRLVDMHGDKLRYCHPWGKWLVWDGKRWLTDNTGTAERLAKDVADSVWRVALDMGDDKSLKFAASTASAGKISSMLSLAASEPGIPVLPDNLDSNPWLLNCPNGTVDLQTGELRPHNRDDLITKLCPTEFNPDSESYNWDRFQEDVADGDGSLIEFKQRLYGYCATGDVREQILCIFHGTGANGKSTELEAITETLGPDYSGAAAKDLLMAKRGDSHPTELADLHGKRLVVAAETENNRSLAESLVKQLTGGDTIKARRMREDFWQFAPTHKLLLCTNHKPRVKGTDHSIWRRLRLIPFSVKFAGERKDKTMPQKLRNERQGILAWIVRGAVEWQASGLGEPECVTAATANYRSSQDVIASFVADSCILGDDMWSKTADLREAFEQWQKEQGDRSIIDGNTFGEGLQRHGCEAKRKNSGRGWQGIGILAEHDTHDAVTRNPG